MAAAGRRRRPQDPPPPPARTLGSSPVLPGRPQPRSGPVGAAPRPTVVGPTGAFFCLCCSRAPDGSHFWPLSSADPAHACRTMAVPAVTVFSHAAAAAGEGTGRKGWQAPVVRRCIVSLSSSLSSSSSSSFLSPPPPALVLALSHSVP
ncbi:hypothetical protein CDD83_8738 [Cordyceps sp. RAO-2017]|nr:hypothetical protein CDD83_8738 [Cordyceps sp. RAO-2017]